MEKERSRHLFQEVKSRYEHHTGNQYGKLIELQLLEPYTNQFLSALYENQCNVRFKYELIMMPNWASKAKIYKLGDDHYTHIRLQRNFFADC